MRMRVSVATQTLRLLDDADVLLREFPVSTAARGVGQSKGSYCTPLGAHYVRAKIGEGCPLNTVFVARRPTGEIYSPELGASQPERDWILTRILWLCGREPGFNRLGACDTMQRYIYIHGSPDETFVAQPLSHGCIRMRNADVLELFNLTPLGTTVDIAD